MTVLSQSLNEGNPGELHLVEVIQYVFSLYPFLGDTFQGFLSPNHTSNTARCNTITANMRNSSWLIREVSSGGLCNMLFGVYSYVPIAKLWKTSLIVGPLYTRKTFDSWHSPSENIPIPFSEFYSISHFKHYWKAKGLDILELKDVHRCINMTAVIVVKRPSFFSQNDGTIMNFIKDAKLTLPLPIRYCRSTIKRKSCIYCIV